MDMEEISRLQFHTNFDSETRNKKIKKIEQRMQREEQNELDGKETGYYDD
jgi:hypothetical protein